MFVMLLKNIMARRIKSLKQPEAGYSHREHRSRRGRDPDLWTKKLNKFLIKKKLNKFDKKQLKEEINIHLHGKNTRKNL